MRSLDRRGLDLAASTIVILIVGIVILGLAFGLTYAVMCGAEEYANQIDSRSEAQVDRLLAGDGLVAVAQLEKTAEAQGSALCGGSRVRTATFALGIKALSTGGGTYDITIAPGHSEDTITYQILEDSVELRASEREMIPILLVAESGTPPEKYAYTVTVTRGGTVHGVQRIYLVVE